LRDLQLVHQRERIIGGRAQAKLFRRAQRMRLAMPARVKSDQAHGRRGPKQAERLVDIRTEAMLKKERQTGTVIAIMELNVIVNELAHTSLIDSRQ
jgi:hypothetical protein